MTTRKVQTKKELKEAIKDEVGCIVISKELEKDIEAIIKVLKMEPKKRNALITFLGAGGAAIVAALAAAPATMGISGIATMPAVVAFAATSGVSVPLIVAIILLCVAIGIPSVVSLIRLYDISDDEYEYEFMGVRFHRKTQYKERQKKTK